MKRQYLILFFATLFSGVLQSQTVVDIIVDSDVHTTLETAVIEADLAGTLSGDGPFTVFAPTDEAFDNLPAGVLDALLDDPMGALTDVLLYHVYGGTALSSDLSDGQMITTLYGDDVTVTINMDGVFINDAMVTMADIMADNGVVHVIDAVLVPMEEPVTVVDIIVNSDVHTTLETAVIEADLAGTLSGDGPFTVFAPTDEAFDNLPAGVLDALLADPMGALTDVLLYHVYGGTALSSDLSDGQMITTLFGDDVTVTINMDGVFINDAMVTMADIMADNGVVHVIDAVLVPMEEPVTVVDIIVNSDVHTTLETAVIEADLAGTLSGDGPFTVFAPTDEAFDNLPAGVLDALLADPMGALTDVLLYHVYGDVALSSDLSDGQMITTLFGDDVTVTINMDGVFINDAMVTMADIMADNGVVHVIDAVLVPMEEPVTVVDIIVNSDVHTTLETAVIEADLAGTLSGDGPFTVFAPTDEAFDNLPAGVLDALLADPMGALTDVLLYHVYGDVALSSDLSDGQMITTLFGDDVTVTINMDGVFINDAMVTMADIMADNGVVHVIDAVLVPMEEPVTVVDIIVNSDVHTTLETAVIEADLAGTLSGDGPFTVFAPTDEAFDNLPAGVLDALLADPMGALTDVLLYHVYGDVALSSDLSDGQMITTLFGDDVTVTINMDGVFINDAMVTMADIMADNGVVHVIDAVLVPMEEPYTVVDVIVNSDVHTTLETAVIEADLAGTLSGDGPFTVFAPTDEAFDNLPAGVLDALLADPMGALTDVLLYHVYGDVALSSDLSDGQMITTLFGDDVTVTINMDGVFINDAMVTMADIIADNGVVHVIDAVLLSDATSIAEQPEDISLNVYPNPTSDFIRVDLSKLSNDVIVKFTNAVGREVLVTNSSNGLFDLSSLVPGLYHIIAIDQGVLISRAIVVQ